MVVTAEADIAAATAWRERAIAAEAEVSRLNVALFFPNCNNRLAHADSQAGNEPWRAPTLGTNDHERRCQLRNRWKRSGERSGHEEKREHGMYHALQDEKRSNRQPPAAPPQMVRKF